MDKPTHSGPSLAIVRWIGTCLILSVFVLPAWATAQADPAATPVVETTPTGTAVATELPAEDAATPEQAFQAARVGSVSETQEGIPTTSFGFTVLPNLDGTTLWDVHFAGDWVFEGGMPLELQVAFEWLATPLAVTCAGSQCSGDASFSGAIVTQYYNGSYIFDGHLLITMPNPTAVGIHKVTAMLSVVGPNGGLYAPESRTALFPVMPPVEPGVTPTTTPTPLPSLTINSSSDLTVTVPSNGNVDVAAVGVHTFLAYPNGTCTAPYTMWSVVMGTPFTYDDSVGMWQEMFDGASTFSMQGVDAENNSMTGCHVVVISDVSETPSTPVATSPPVATTISTTTSMVEPQPTTARVQALPVTGIPGGGNGVSPQILVLIGATLIAAMACVVVEQRRRR